MVTMRQGASLPWSGVRSASMTMSLSCAASGPGATISRALPERRVARWARSDELSLNMVRHVGFAAPARKCGEQFATDFCPCQPVTGAIRIFPYADRKSCRQGKVVYVRLYMGGWRLNNK